MKTRTLTLTILPTLLAATTAAAAEDCAGDDWFCAEEATEVPASEEAAEPSDEVASPSDEAPPEPVVIDSRPVDKPRPEAVGRPRVIYTSSSSPARVSEDDQTSAKRNERERLRHFGFNLRISGMLQERNQYTHPDAGLTGFGVGFRFIPVSFLTLEPGIDGFAGHDHLGRERTETTLSFNSILTLNPNDPIQIYGLIGVFTTTAEVKGVDSGAVLRSGAGRYSYVGAQVGAGIELRLDPALGFHADIIGYSRQRNELPSYGETNADLRRDGGGGLVRAGMSLYF